MADKFATWKLDLLDRMLADRRLSLTDFGVAYCFIGYMDAATGDCFPAQETVAADLDLSVRSVQLSLGNLRDQGWLKIESRPRPKGRGRSNFYRFGDHPADATTRNTLQVNEATTRRGEADFMKSDSGASPKEEHVELREHVGERARVRAPTADRGSRIPDNFKPDLDVAIAEGMTTPQAKRSALSFVDYWKAEPGAKGRKLDWNATWRRWARKDAADLARGHRPSLVERPETDADYAMRMLKEHLAEEPSDAEPTDPGSGLFLTRKSGG